MPLVSVVLPTYARNKLLRDSIASVLAQDMPDLELFVLDDGSVDGSADTISEFASADSRVKHVRFEKNIGLPALTCAHGYARSSGEYVAWQFDDCTWTPDHLSVLLAAFRPGVGVAYGQIHLHHADGAQTFGQPFDMQLLRKGNILANVAALVHRKVYDKIGWIDPSVLLKRSNDYDFWIRAGQHFEFAFCKHIVAEEHGQLLHDSLGNSVSLDLSLMARYMGVERSEYLQISNMANWKPFAAQDWMTATEQEELAYLTMEHFFRIGRKEEGFAHVRALLPDAPTDLAALFVKMLTTRRDAKLTEQASYIQAQERLLNERMHILDERLATIRELEGAIRSLQRPLVVRAVNKLRRLVA